MKIGVFANCEKPTARQTLRALDEAAARLGLELVAAEPAAGMLKSVRGPVSPSDLARSADILLVMGGDGTMLRAFRSLDGADVPMMGVNLGGLGFLTSVSQSDLGQALECLAAGRFSVGERSVAQCEVVRAGRRSGRHQALNDVVVERGGSPRIVGLNVTMDGEEVLYSLCDGLVVATPTGSTGHSLSAGGPVLDPDLAAFVLTLICPHTLSGRPLVVPDSRTLTIEIDRCEGEVMLSIDGQRGPALRAGDAVRVSRGQARARFVRLPGFNHFSLLRQKLHWRGAAMHSAQAGGPGA